MLEYTNADPEVCVIGRTDFSTGIGRHTYAFAELLSRSYATCIQPTDGHAGTHVLLPNGRSVPVWRGSNVRASVFVDVLWNGVGDHKVAMTPQHGLRLAILVWDSDQLPDEWVEILNHRFDAAVCLSPHLVATARRNGVTIPCACVPLALPLEDFLSQPVARPNKTIRFGSVSSFHPRKNTLTLIDAFRKTFGSRDDVELVIHSNLSFGDTFRNLRDALEAEGVRNITLSMRNIDESEKNKLINSFDIFVNLSRGEGYSIGAREALAMGKPLVLSKVGGHVDLEDAPGVFLVEPAIALPARYPEIDNRVFGRQMSVTEEASAEALQAALDYVRSDRCALDVHARRQCAAQFSMDALALPVASLLDERLLKFRNDRKLPGPCALPDAYFSIVRSRLEAAGGLQQDDAHIVQMHDGGFFSIFNVFFSHLVWDLRDGRCHRVLPDWDVGRFLERMTDKPILSFCYGQPRDGNIWTQLFKPLFGLSIGEMQQGRVLYHRARPPLLQFNERREPLLTYKHAAALYQLPTFNQFRRQYARVFQQHIHLEPQLQHEIDDFADRNMKGYTVLGAHVRHPSHTVEQPGAVIAHAEHYIDALNALALARGHTRRGTDWRVFLASDQDRVIERFKTEYGDRLVFVENVRRTTDAEDSAFDTLSDKNVDGYQLQHLVARNTANWSLEMAREVLRDAYLMAQCDTLHHVVSNVSTAVSYINSNVDMYYHKGSHFEVNKS